MRLRTLDPRDPAQPGRAARRQLFAQMRPLVVDLPARDAERAVPCGPRDLRRVEVIAAPLGFGRDRAQIFGDAADGPACLAEAGELRVVRVALRLATEDGLRQERLAPQGHEALR